MVDMQMHSPTPGRCQNFEKITTTFNIRGIKSGPLVVKP